MKKILLIASLLTANAATASTAVFLGGFSFDNLSTGLFDQNADATNDASYSLDYPGASISGEVWADGSFGSTNLGNVGATFVGGDAQGVDGTLASGTDIIGSLNDFPSQGSKLRIGGEGAFTVQFDGTGYEQFEFYYSALESSVGDGSVNWSISNDGTNFSAVEQDQFTITDTQYSLNLSGFNSINDGTFFLRGQVATADYIDFDNLAVYGDVSTSVVPEPSTYAMIMAVFAGAVVFFRRRRG